MEKYRSLVLPLAILMGLFLHPWCAYAAPVVPYLIFTILLLNYSAVDVSKLKPSLMDLWLGAFQVAVCAALYLGIKAVCGNEILSQGAMMVVLCPVAASVVVVSCILGADRERVTTFTILDNLLVSIAAPAAFSLIGAKDGISFWPSFLMIFKKTFLIIALPFIVALIGQRVTPAINAKLKKIKGASFYLWALTLTITIGQTIHYIFLHGKDNLNGILLLGLLSVILCIIQFAVGKAIGAKYGDKIAGGQLLGQKNVALGVWMSNLFLSPLSSVGIALYSIWQNIFNSYQMWRHDNR